MFRSVALNDSVSIPLRQLHEKYATRVTVRLAGHEHTLRQARSPRGGQESPMEVAALVLFSSIALWFAEEISGNQL